MTLKKAKKGLKTTVTVIIHVDFTKIILFNSANGNAIYYANFKNFKYYHVYF